MTGLSKRHLRTALAAAFFIAALPSISGAAATRRVSHTATLLTTGDLLIAGGVNQGGATQSSAEIFAASRGNVIIPTGAMGVTVASHTATLLPNGCVLVAGGNSAVSDVAAPVASAVAKIYDPATSTWGNPVGAQTTLLTARYNHTATLLNSGAVLICGGQDAVGTALSSCELYTPTAAPGNACANGTFTAASSLLQARYNHTATLLKDGKVWFAGGRNPAIGATGGYLVTTERYDPGTGNFQSASPMIEARSNHSATLMGDGKVLAVGGYNFRDVLANKGITQSAEIYDPISNSVTPAASMSSRRHSHSTVLDASGEVVVYGGLGNITTTYVLPTDLFVTGQMETGSVLVAGAPIAVPTATISGTSTGLIKIDFLLNKPVFGEIADGEIWFSSPSIRTAWGAIRFVPASETNPAVGLRVNLAGISVGCRLPFAPGLITNNCGNVAMSLTPAVFSNMQGQVIFNRRIGIGLLGAPVVASGNLFWAGGALDAATTVRSVVNGNGSSFTTTVLVPMDDAFIGHTINSGSFRITDATLVQASSFTLTLTSGTANIPATVVGTDANGAGQAVLNLTFNNLDGLITYTGSAPQTFASGVAIPQAGANMTVGVTGNMSYTVDGANLAGNVFNIDVATVVIRKMLYADNETYNPKTNAWDLQPPGGAQTTDARFGHTATLLPNNDKVIIGGRTCNGAACATLVATPSVGFQLLAYEKNFGLAAGQGTDARAFHTSTLLPNGDIIVAGGTNGPSILSSAEIFSPTLDVFAPVNGGMRYVRDLHTATLLPNGRVLIAGGFTTNAASTGSTNTSEIYYPDTKRFIETTPMISSRSNHSAILLPDGNVFVAGGFGPNDIVTGTSEIFVSTMSMWMTRPSMTMPANCERAIHATVQLKTGHILLIGGINASGPLDTTADYDPATNSWSCGSVAVMPSPLRSHSATLLFDGRVLVAGGNDGLGEANKSFIYDPPSNTWTATDPLPLLEPRFNHTATLLPNGTVMISGGSQRFGNVPTSIEVFHVNGSSWVTGGLTTGMSFGSRARAFHTMTLALNNKIYAIGGSDGVVGGIGVSLYKTAEAGYFTTTADQDSKNFPPSFRQSVISGTSATPFLPGTNLTANGLRFRGGTEGAGGGAASGNSAFSFPHMVLQQVDGSGGAASQSNGGFVVDLTTQVFLNVNNVATLDTSLTVALPASNNAMPYGWYALRTGANDIYSAGKLVQVGPPKPVLAPANISGVAAGISSMTWTWDRIVGVDGYNVYNATTGVFISSIPSSLSSRATFYQTALDASATSSVLIAGYTLTGDGPLTASPTSYTLAAAPINVTVASVTFSDLLLYWGTNGNSAPGTVYEVTSSSDNFVTDVSTPVPLLFSLATNFTTINNLAANTTYFFRVQAFNLVGIPSPYSLSVSTRTRAPVAQPTVAGRTTTSIDWVWAPTAGITNYRVFNATNSVLLGTPAVNSYTEVNLGTNTNHSIVVTAVTSAGEGPLSLSASAYTLAAVPGPFNPIANPTTGTITLNWVNNGNPLNTVYNIQLTQFASDGSVVKVSTDLVDTLPFTYVFGALPPSTLYGYQITARNGDNPAVISAALSGSTWTIPSAPTLSPVATSPTSISVAWATNNNSSSTTYEVIYTSQTFAVSSATAISFAANYHGNNATIGGLITSTTYSILVTARNPFGQVGAPSNQITTDTFNGGAAIGSVAGTLLTNSNSMVQGSLGNGRGITIRAPALTFPTDVTITISSFTPLTAAGLCPGTTVLAFSITDTPALQPIGSLYLSFDFLPAELGTIPSNRALLMRYEPVSGTCVPLETVIDSANNVMTARINHFSLFVLGQALATTTAETARIFPNPYYTSRDGFVTIDNVPPLARVRIFTLRGEQVLDVKANSAGLLTWSGTNGSGRAVASGVYIVLIESGGTTKTMKLAVIR